MTAAAVEVRMTAEAAEVSKAVAALCSVTPRLAPHRTGKQGPDPRARGGGRIVSSGTSRVGFQRVEEFGLGRNCCPGKGLDTPWIDGGRLLNGLQWLPALCRLVDGLSGPHQRACLYTFLNKDSAQYRLKKVRGKIDTLN